MTITWEPNLDGADGHIDGELCWQVKRYDPGYAVSRVTREPGKSQQGSSIVGQSASLLSGQEMAERRQREGA